MEDWYMYIITVFIRFDFWTFMVAAYSRLGLF